MVTPRPDDARDFEPDDFPLSELMAWVIVRRNPLKRPPK